MDGIDVSSLRRRFSGRREEGGERLYGFAELEPYAVFLPVVERDGEAHLLFEVRARTLRRQPGEVSFPGGRVEPDDASPAETALREAAEELGLSRERLSLWSKLGILLPPYQAAVHAYVGEIPASEAIRPNPAEVDHVFTVPVGWFLVHPPEVYEATLTLLPGDDFPFERIPGGRSYPFRRRTIPELFYLTDRHVIWGLTARLVHIFLQLVQKMPEP
ncbi:CoA pyrophosphatase [Hydrogenibacillus sp. N12]|uniref:NUDIX hydrolase n=1 Tax=Hydrogenibacillus sp. N12 TaxID=2866627 RepID=UPI001C7CA238|nr:CoA pyrophosphatase [Hydrogenibacillus sp. N12]QZA32749.1 CoA pyrophosphatase [Hydrogenibacillus sp. N12]